MKLLLRVGFFSLCALLLQSPGWALTQVSGFGSNPGSLTMFKYVPSGLPANAPLVVALHGCAQSASSYDEETGWVLLADRWKFALLLPEQTTSNNSSRCFNWFEAGDIGRGAGEALSIKQMVDKMKADHLSDPARVYVTGLSAGGAFTAVMLATYPDVFAGGAIVAGVPYNCGTGLTAAFSCMNPGSDLSPTAWGNKVRAASSHNGPWPIVSIWHGDADTTVRPANANESMEQWTNVHGVDQTPEVQDTVGGYPHKVYKNASGEAVVETWSITGMGHGTPVDPGSGERQCGTAGAYILDVDLCSSWYIGRFFGLDNSDSVAPTVSLTAPANGANVSGLVSINASASDNVGVTEVEFLIDGVLAGSDATAPYSYAWNSAAGANGTRRLQARAVDAAGNVGSSAEFQVNVSGGIEDSTPPSVNLGFPGNGATVNGTITLAATATDDFGVASVEFFVDGASLGEGNQSAQAGPWTLDWNSSSVSNGPHALSVVARDARGNQSIDDDTSVTVNQTVLAVDESFSNRDANGDYFDQGGWSGDFVADADNVTAGAGGSQSSYGYASSGLSCAVGLKTRYLQRSVVLGSAPRLSYARKLDLRAQINSSTYARFRVLVNGSIVDEASVTYANYVDPGWTSIENLDLSAWAGQTVSLRFEASAYGNVCLEAWSKARIDDIRVGNASEPADTTPPVVNLSAPANAATVSGTVDLTATASDAAGVTKVEFYANGSLLGVDLSSPYSWSWNTAAMADGSYALMARAFDAAGNMGSDNDTIVTVQNGTGGGGGGTPVVVSFASEAGYDGYVKASANGSGLALGTLESSFGLALGRGSDGKYNRAILSFDTSSLPDGAQIQSATLTLRHRGASGDPWSSPSGNTLVIDVKSGCFGACALETSDHGASASANQVASVVRFTGGNQNSGAFNGAGLAAISTTDRTQVRLRFEQNQGSTSYLWIGSGVDATLQIEYLP
ncbi:MAG: PHB depolymerase family esterase [Rhodanobacteraceae bacterium]|nr:PHB depolymerase family esterase [Rhodanobacteraceae bacterium]